jgi:hypothetical protein
MDLIRLMGRFLGLSKMRKFVLQLIEVKSVYYISHIRFNSQRSSHASQSTVCPTTPTMASSCPLGIMLNITEYNKCIQASSLRLDIPPLRIQQTREVAWVGPESGLLLGWEVQLHGRICRIEELRYGVYDIRSGTGTDSHGCKSVRAEGSVA